MRTPAFWTARSPRERTILAAVTALAALLLVLAFAWLPLERSRARIATELPQLRASVERMRAQAAEVKALRAQPPRAPATPLATLVDSNTLVQGLAGARITLVDARHARLAVDDAAWTRLVEWLAQAQSVHGLAVAEAKVEALASLGRVRGEFLLVAP